MGEKKIKWFKAAESRIEVNWKRNELAVVEVAGKKITLARVGEQIFAFAYKCPHAGGILADGFIDAVGNIVCPLHRYKFSLKNGRNVTGEGYYLKTFPLEEREAGIFVGFEENPFMKLFG
jgi:3-phenylpropionate/trans-cinnamate dioxygenase ferredoxin subunit